MKKVIISILFLIQVAFAFASKDYFNFGIIRGMPTNQGYMCQPGLAGTYAGIDQGVLIIAGGANFPDKMPWQGGAKVYYDDIFVMQKGEEENYIWSRIQQKLPNKGAYGGAISTSHGLFCFGGNSNNQCFNNSWLLKYNRATNEVEIVPGPQLPIPLANFATAEVNGKIYVAGGISEINGVSGHHFFCLDITEEDPRKWQWEELPHWNGAPRSFAVGVAQSNGVDNCFYLFSGWNKQAGKQPEVLYDAHVFNPSTGDWKIISKGTNKEFPFLAGTTFSLGTSSIVFASGVNGEIIERQQAIENEIERIKKLSDAGEDIEEELQEAQKKLTNHLVNHPGFGKKLTCYNTLSKETYEIGELPEAGHVGTTTVIWDDYIVIPSGEIHPGVRTPNVLKIEVNKSTLHLSSLDILVIALYFLVLAWMGFFFSKRQKNTNDYFKGGGRVPWWAAGLSIFGTALSAITFMAIPAKTFATDWSYFMLNMSIFLVAPLIVYLFIPFYRKLDVTTAYEFLEKRFNLVVRLIGSLSFILFQVGRMGVVLFLPSIALNVATGIDIFICIALMGIVSLVYTMMGGIEAVIWTDVIQVIVLLGGAILSLFFIIFSLEEGLSSIIETARESHKFNLIDLECSLRQPTVWVMLLGGIFANITTYGTDQTMVQRYMTTKTKKEACKSVWTNAILVVPATIIFFFVGTALFVFYKHYPAELNPTIVNNDAIFPWYIASQLPAGISGLLIAAIFAAAMSSLSSSMNSAATAYATDIHFRFGWSRNVDQLILARIATLVIGITGIMFAFLMATWDIKSLWDVFQKVLGLVIGGLGGVFILGVFSKRVNSTSALIGLGISILVQVLVSIYPVVHLLMYAATGFVSCFVAGYVASLFFKQKTINK